MDLTLKRTPTWLPSGGFLLLVLGWTCGCHQDVRPQGGLQLARISWIYLCLPLAPGDIIVLSHPFYQVQFMTKAHTQTLAHFLQVQQFVIHCAFLFVLYPFIIFSHIFYPLHSFFLPPACQLRHGHTTYIM